MRLSGLTSVVKAAASLALGVTTVGCSNQTRLHSEGRFKEPIAYEALKRSQLPIFERSGVQGEELLKQAYEKGKQLVYGGGELKNIIANTDFIYDSVRLDTFDGPRWVGAIHAMSEAEEKGILDGMLEKGLITAERHEFLSNRLGSYLWNNPIDDQYLLSSSKEKKLIEELVSSQIIDEKTRGYFNSEEWFKQFEGVADVEKMFKVLAYGVKNEKLDNDLVTILVESKNYNLANKVAQLYIAGKLNREETTSLIRKLNIKFANAILNYPFESRFFTEYRFEAEEVLPLLFARYETSTKPNVDKLSAAKTRNQELLTKGSILGGWARDIKDSFSDLGINYFDVLDLNKNN